MSRFKEIIKTDKVTPDKFKLLYNELLLMHSENFLRQNESQCLKVIELIIEYLVSSDKSDVIIFE
jgi:hypothetical protein